MEKLHFPWQEIKLCTTASTNIWQNIDNLGKHSSNAGIDINSIYSLEVCKKQTIMMAFKNVLINCCFMNVKRCLFMRNPRNWVILCWHQDAMAAIHCHLSHYSDHHLDSVSSLLVIHCIHQTTTSGIMKSWLWYLG